MPRRRTKAPKPSAAELTTQITTQPMGAGLFPGIGPLSGMVGNEFLCGTDNHANGGTSSNPCAFPGYEHLYGAAFWSYWWMLQHPVLRLARAVSCAPIQASTWTFESVGDELEEDEEEELAALLTRNLMPVRRDIVNHALRGRDFGRAPFEPVWDVVSTKANGTEYRLVDMVPLPIETTGVYRDDHGRFAGLAAPLVTYANQMPMTTGSGVVPGLPAPYKAWLYVYDDYARMLLGRSWLENVRQTAWRDWLDAAQQLQRLGAKLAGIFSVITGPAGDIPGAFGADGKPQKYSTAAKSAIDNFAAGGHGAYIPTLSIPFDGQNIDLMKLLVQLMRSSLIDFKLLDFGNNAPAIAGILDRMKHDEELMFMGALMPSRVAQEGQHGTKAEAGQHTATATIIIENDNDDIAHQLQPLVDGILVLNVPEYRPGTMRCKAPPLEPRKLEKQIEIFNTCATSQVPGLFDEFGRVVDVTDLLKNADFKVLDKWNPENLTEAAENAALPPMPGTAGEDGDVPPGLAKRMGAANRKTAKKINGNGAARA